MPTNPPQLEIYNVMTTGDIAIIVTIVVVAIIALAYAMTRRKK